MARQRPGVPFPNRDTRRCFAHPAFLPQGHRSGGAEPAHWTPRELRHSFVSLLSDAGVPVEQTSRLVGHSGTTTTETVYRKQIRPVIIDGAEVMNRLFPSPGETAPDA